MKFMWTTFFVKDLEKSMYFYTELLGLPVNGKFGGEGHQIVMLGEEKEPKVELIYNSGTEISGVGVGVSVGLAFANLDQLVERLKAEGLEVTGPISPGPQMRFFFVKDPDGYEIQLLE